AQAIRRFLAVDAAPADAFAAVRAIGGDAGPLAAALDAWAERLERLVAAGTPADRMRFAATLGHSFDYYDGATFEVRSTALGADRPVAVGGRYDSLPARLGGAAARAVGGMVR